MRRGRPLGRSFYARDSLAVAPDLLHKVLVHDDPEHGRVAARIVEVEAYRGGDDPGSHGFRGPTPRTASMFGPPGHLYVYFTYGMHWCLNAVTGAVDYPAAVLIRAIRPEEGLEDMALRRGRFPRSQWCNGPAKLTQALCIDGSLNGVSLCDRNSGLWIEAGEEISEDKVRTTPRIGIDSVPEPWKSKPWRFLAELPEKL